MEFETDSGTGVLYASFNQDQTNLIIGTMKGFAVYSLFPFKKVFEKEQSAVSVCEMLFSTALIALVGTENDSTESATRKLHIFNTKLGENICTLDFITPILAVKMNRKRVAVVLETKIHLYDVTNNMKLLFTIDTNPNPKGLCALTPNDRSYLAYPRTSETGEVVVWDAIKMDVLKMVQAHKGPLAAISLDNDGTLLATASAKGTVIRVHALQEADKMYSCRRGTTPANICSLVFARDPTAPKLIVSSDTGTIHVFRIDRSSPTNETPLRYYLGTLVSDAWDPQRSYLTVRLPRQGIKVMAALSGDQQEMVVVTADGHVLKYRVDANAMGPTEVRNPLEDYSICDQLASQEMLVSQFL